jgi:hypothetical protein
VEAEADRALRRRQQAQEKKKNRRIPVTLVGSLRAALGWDHLLVPAEPDAEIRLVDTDRKDFHVLASAMGAGAVGVVTANVSDFGIEDLERVGMCAIHPDLFLAKMLTDDMYVHALEDMAARRSAKPNTPDMLHARLGREHPLLAEAMAHVFPDVVLSRPVNNPPTERFRGLMCVIGKVTLP